MLRWLDRLWLCAVALAFIIMAPIWIILMTERLGLPTVVGALVFALSTRFRPDL